MTPRFQGPLLRHLRGNPLASDHLGGDIAVDGKAKDIADMRDLAVPGAEITVRAMLARAMGVAPTHLPLIRGQSARDKTFRYDGV